MLCVCIRGSAGYGKLCGDTAEVERTDGLVADSGEGGLGEDSVKVEWYFAIQVGVNRAPSSCPGGSRTLAAWPGKRDGGKSWKNFLREAGRSGPAANAAAHQLGRSEDMLKTRNILSVLAVASFAMGVSGIFNSAMAQPNGAESMITGCLTDKGQLENIAFGEDPRKKCKKHETPVTIPLQALSAPGQSGDCPCDFFSVPYSVFSPSSQFAAIDNLACHLANTGVGLNPPLFETNTLTHQCFMLNISPLPDVVREGLTPAQTNSCGVLIEIYASQLYRRGVNVSGGDAGGNFDCLIPDN
jgi:hypothetical protein